MAKVTIMLACAAGMSTSLLVTKMQKAAEDKGLDAEIFAVPAPEAEEIVATKEVNVLLLGPQVRYLLGDFQEKLKDRQIPVAVIPMTDYGMMNGSKVLDLAESLLDPNHSYLSQLDVTYKTPDLMSHFLPPHEVSFTFCCSSIVFPR
ncbi:lichenan-specific phosphotransferase enzyme iib component (pts system lichenan-specific eiib component) (eiib-lic) [Streptococcus pneumoniae]|nr:lichenan-specific phosphotransferase enzyme iib component (pts system lichenan-specific eiib component) (eiib-lic) [Streptococcus pneumoniae]